MISRRFIIFIACLAIGLSWNISGATAENTDPPAKPTTAKPTTAKPTTAKPTTAKPTTAKPTTAKPTTAKPTTAKPTTAKPTTAKPTTAKPTTAKPTTAKPTTAKPTTAKPTTAKPTTAKPTTAKPTTAKPTTAKPTTAKPTTAKPTTAKPTTAKPTTAKPTTAKPTTAKPTTAKPTTAKPTTAEPTTVKPTTAKPTTAAPTTRQPTTIPPTAPGSTAAPSAPTFNYPKENPCITVKADITIYYFNQSFEAPASAIATGECLTNQTGSIKLSWGTAGVNTEASFSMDFKIEDNSWKITNISASVGEAEGTTSDAANMKPIHASMEHSYRCDRIESIPLNTDMKVEIKNLQLQPIPLKDGKFLKDVMCPANPDNKPTSSIVPIAVGCALAGLIVIVLIAYLVGRRKGSRGYQQV